MKVKLVSCTQVEPEYLNYLENELKIPTEFYSILKSPEGLMAYCARVSSPNQANPKYAGLLQYCQREGHWSVFELVDVTFEIQTSRGISPQILRHRSNSFQEFSQRYAAVGEDGMEFYKLRRQDSTNRQNSIDDISEEDQEEFLKDQQEVWNLSYTKYKKWLDRGGAKECVRTLLPLGTKTRLFMKGSARSMIHYVNTRTHESTQAEHREIANEIKKLFAQKFPILAESLGWIETNPTP